MKLYEDVRNAVVQVGNVAIGRGQPVVLIAGPCAAETQKQVMLSAKAAKEAGAGILRGGAFKPRTSCRSWQGSGHVGLRWLRDAGAKFGLPLVTEVMDKDDLPLVKEHADMIQIGTRNMQNFSLLRAVGRSERPVLLKRGMAATIKEWLCAAEYVLDGGAQVVLCERGIRTFGDEMRNTLDISAVLLAQSMSSLPVVVDPSHAVGKAEFVARLALASVAVGADGVMVDVHPNSKDALVDAEQALSPEELKMMSQRMHCVVHAFDREMHRG